jgi:ABC-type glycerol-3-phosphate transport system permease component
MSRRTTSLIEALKHSFIWGVLVFSFFPLFVTFNISVKNNKQFNVSPFGFLPLSGLTETFAREPASESAYDPISITAARDAVESGVKPGDSAWPTVRRSTAGTWHWENWTRGWQVVSGYIFNTIFLAVTTVLFALVCSVAAAFYFARYRMPGHRIMWYFFLILMLMPGIANLIPLFILLRNLHMLNSLWALIVTGVAGAQVVQIYILRNFIEEIPQDLFDAAEVDGARPWQQLLHIVLPFSGSVLSTLAILQFLGVWNNFLLPFLIIRDDALLPLAAGLIKLDGEYVKEWGRMMAGYAIASLPLVVIFFFTMRLFVKGIAAGAVKG